MVQLQIKTKDIVINGEKYTLRPLTGQYLPQLWEVIGKFEGDPDAEKKPLKDLLDAQAVKNIHLLGVETMKKSYPDMSVQDIDEFVSQNLLVFMQALLEVNMNIKAE